MMRCWNCNATLMWISDEYVTDEEDEYKTVTNLECPQCKTLVQVYTPKMAVPTGLEPVTYCLEGSCSIQLS